LRLAAHIMRHPEFSEGVRALLIDKDRNPRWTYDAVGSVPSNVLDGFFSDAPGAPVLELP